MRGQVEKFTVNNFIMMDLVPLFVDVHKKICPLYITKNMPSTLQNAYGKSWGSSSTIVNPPTIKNLGATIGEDVSEIFKPVTKPRTSSREESIEYVFEIRIDQQDCHLICLFLGVFTLSLLLNRNNLPASS